ncbi:MAG: prepilin-type N-terminal cleavage/methylation domain-containing protein [Candidatus Omnitrophica bacterium]|nr:prepilin-type N-terminal cleavage/methylation domain-containing protein [Candidatus Omnitrophota bacterium]
MHPKKGFTLIEITISLTVFTIIALAISVAFYKAYSDWRRQRNISRCLQDAQWAMTLMSNEIRASNASLMNDSNFTNPPALYLRLPSGGGNANNRVWYWRGNNSDAFGQATMLYRAERNNDQFAQAASSANRQELASCVVDFNYTVRDRGLSNSSVALNLTIRPKPLEPERPGNSNITLHTVVRPKN